MSIRRSILASLVFLITYTTAASTTAPSLANDSLKHPATIGQTNPQTQNQGPCQSGYNLTPVPNKSRMGGGGKGEGYTCGCVDGKGDWLDIYNPNGCSYTISYAKKGGVMQPFCQPQCGPLSPGYTGLGNTGNGGNGHPANKPHQQPPNHPNKPDQGGPQRKPDPNQSSGFNALDLKLSYGDLNTGTTDQTAGNGQGSIIGSGAGAGKNVLGQRIGFDNLHVGTSDLSAGSSSKPIHGSHPGVGSNALDLKLGYKDLHTDTSDLAAGSGSGSDSQPTYSEKDFAWRHGFDQKLGYKSLHTDISDTTGSEHHQGDSSSGTTVSKLLSGDYQELKGNGDKQSI